DIGYGVFTTQPLPQGTFIWVLDYLDHVLTKEQVSALPLPLRRQVDKYGYNDPLGNTIFCWDHARYMNHSCEPTSRAVGDCLEVAIRDIQAGEQLTCEYAVFNIAYSWKCDCGSAACRGAVSPHDVSRLYAKWDVEVRESLSTSHEVPQLLLPFIREG